MGPLLGYRYEGGYTVLVPEIIVREVLDVTFYEGAPRIMAEQDDLAVEAGRAACRYPTTSCNLASISTADNHLSRNVRPRFIVSTAHTYLSLSIIPVISGVHLRCLGSVWFTILNLSMISVGALFRVLVEDRFASMCVGNWKFRSYSGFELRCLNTI